MAKKQNSLDPLGMRGGNNPVYKGDRWEIGCGRGEPGTSPKRLVCCAHVYMKDDKWFDRFSGKRHRCSFPAPPPPPKPVPVPPKDWFTDLSPQAKAEILSGVLHETESDMFEARAKEVKELIRAALRDCSILYEALSQKDIEDIQMWFNENDPKWKTRKK